MTKIEAINIVRNIHQTDAEKEALEMLIPELAESEDERIRKDIRLVIESAATRYFKETGKMPEWYDRIVAYLEKQKDASKAIEAVDRIDKYIDENVANAHDMKDSNPDKKYYRGWDDALAEMSRILQDVYSVEKQKEQKPTPVWMPKFLDELRSKKNYFDWDEHRDIEGHILAIINWIAPDYFDRKEKGQKSNVEKLREISTPAVKDELKKY